MPPDGESPYGRPYGDPFPDAYGDPYGEPGEDDPGSPRGSEGGWSYGEGEEFQRAVDALADPLSDPLPGQDTGRGTGTRQEPSGEGYAAQGYTGQGYQEQGYQGQSGAGQEYRAQGYSAQEYAQGQAPGAYEAPGQRGAEALDGVSPWFRPHLEPGAAGGEQGGQGRQGQHARQPAQQSQEPGGYEPGNRSGQAPSSPPQQGYGGGRQVPYGGAQSGLTQQGQARGEGSRRQGSQGPGGPGQAPQAPQAPRAPQAPQAPQALPAAPGTAAGPPVTGHHPGVRWNRVAPASASGPRRSQTREAPQTPGTAQTPQTLQTPRTPVDGVAARSHRRHAARPAEPAPTPIADEPGSERASVASSPGTASRTAAGTSSTPSTDRSAPGVEDDDEKTNTSTVGLVRPSSQAFAGRAARRRAAQRRGRGGGRGHGKGSGSSAGTPPPTRGTRLEARRAERARREGPAIIASRFLGETFISAGALLLLFVAYQLWWTNVLAGQEAGGAARSLQDQWKGGKNAASFAAGERFAILYLPKLDVRVPIAQGVSKPQVLDKGLVGHYDKQPFKTAMPWDRKGNFALAGHRNTHGEPFRYINRLVAGDDIVVETATKFYSYKVASRLPSTSPANTRVIEPVPVGSGFQRPGRYVTLTTCTPEFTSKYRLIVWGKMVGERPRSEGKPDALVG